ncbi:MAG: MFS transporter [Halanaerobiales bacterium]
MKIKKDKNIKKFSYYGFFKNLKFFEPFLYIFFLNIGFSYFQIGSLISIREITKNIFEVPSGIYADNYGRKTSLQICFVSYIISFIIFYLGNIYLTMAFAMILFGIGEAFRSGTHKAIIFNYLDVHNIADMKTEVYGRTKSYSLIGASISAVIGGFIVFVRSNYRLIFLFSIIPYIIDFILISTYPDYLNGEINKKAGIKEFIMSGVESVKNLFTILTDLRKGIINSGIYDGYFKVLKDYLQPILKAEIMAVPFLSYISSQEKRLSILLGFSYAIINLISSFASRNAYKAKNIFKRTNKSLNIIYLITIVILGFIAATINSGLSYLVIILFLIFYVIRTIRRPIMLDYIGGIIKEKERATMLSIESQFRTIFIIVVAPVMGYIADLWGLKVIFFTASLSMFVILFLTRLSSIKDSGS